MDLGGHLSWGRRYDKKAVKAESMMMRRRWVVGVISGEFGVASSREERERRVEVMVGGVGNGDV